IVVHARTKADGYRPPAYWDRIADLKREVKLPLVANGEIWTVEDALRAQAASGCTSLMLGRGMVADPGLALAIRAAWRPGDSEGDGSRSGEPSNEYLNKNADLSLDSNDQLATFSDSRRPSACGFSSPLATAGEPHVGWADLLPLLGSFWQRVEQRVERRHRAGRLKQWLNLLRRRYPEAQAAFDSLRTVNDADTLQAWLVAQAPAPERFG
ncbi:MAG: tRNA-dihydrouridine synthase, partial [Burkholderiaceae bacterium]